MHTFSFYEVKSKNFTNIRLNPSRKIGIYGRSKKIQRKFETEKELRDRERYKMTAVTARDKKIIDFEMYNVVILLSFFVVILCLSLPD
jgi:hypothetical protein